MMAVWDKSKSWLVGNPIRVCYIVPHIANVIDGRFDSASSRLLAGNSLGVVETGSEEIPKYAALNWIFLIASEDGNFVLCDVDRAENSLALKSGEYRGTHLVFRVLPPSRRWASEILMLF